MPNAQRGRGLVLVGAVLGLVPGCSSSDTAGGAAGDLAGTLYVNASDNPLHKIDLATGTHTALGIGEDVQKTTQGTFVGIANGDLVDAPESFATTRIILDHTAVNAPNADPDCGNGVDKPRQSPDGTKVVFTRYTTGVVCILDFQTGALVSKIKDDKLALGYTRASWTPDGRLVFTEALGSGGIFLTDATLQNPTRIDPNLSNTVGARVSHDGKQVAFVSASKVWKMGIDGSNPVQMDLRDDVALGDDLPIWSPDDTKLGYECDSDFCIQDASGPGQPAKLFTLYPDLANKLTIVSKSYSPEWVP